MQLKSPTASDEGNAGRDLAEHFNSLFLDVYIAIAIADRETPIQSHGELSSKARVDADRLGQDLTGLRVLEVGPGSGHLTRLLRERGAIVTCLDLVDTYRDNPEFQGASFVIGDIQNMGFCDEFDVAVATDVLEHVLRPGDAMISLRRALRPGGMLYLRCPAYEPLHVYAMQSGCAWPAVHLRTYTKDLLLRETLASGFIPTRGPAASPTGYGFPRWAGLRVRALAGRSVQTSHAGASRIADAILNGWIRLENLVPFMQSSSEVWVLASKPVEAQGKIAVREAIGRVGLNRRRTMAEALRRVVHGRQEV